MKKLKSLLILPLLLILLTGCFFNKVKVDKVENVEKTSTPLFYKITKKNSNTNIYLLGSIHAADNTAYPFRNSIMNAFNDSDYLAVEIDLNEFSSDYNAQLSLTKKLMYSDGTTIKDHLGEELYNSMVNLLKEKNSYSSLYDNYKPVFFESLFENVVIKDANMSSNKGIDNYFLKLAKENNKEILEIESADFQYDLLLSFPDELEKMTISDYVNNYEESVSEMRELYEAWKRGNVEELNQLFFAEDYEDLTEEQIKLMRDYNNALINDRNYNMVNTLEKYFNDGKNVFCVVGLGHVISEDGIAMLMQRDGYIVEEIG